MIMEFLPIEEETLKTGISAPQENSMCKIWARQAGVGHSSNAFKARSPFHDLR